MTRIHELIQHFEQLDTTQQNYLLNYARILTQTPVIKGESGESLVATPRLFDDEALDEMQSAIDSDCEEIDWREWE